MIGEEREKKTEDSEIFQDMVLKSIVKDTSTIEEEKIETQVKISVFKLLLDTIDGSNKQF